MDLTHPSQANLKYILDGLSEHLSVANKGLMDPEDYNIEKYDELKFMYDMILEKGKLSISESQAFVEELRTMRKN